MKKRLLTALCFSFLSIRAGAMEPAAGLDAGLANRALHALVSLQLLQNADLPAELRARALGAWRANLLSKRGDPTALESAIGDLNKAMCQGTLDSLQSLFTTRFAMLQESEEELVTRLICFDQLTPEGRALAVSSGFAETEPEGLTGRTLLKRLRVGHQLVMLMRIMRVFRRAPGPYDADFIAAITPAVQCATGIELIPARYLPEKDKKELMDRLSAGIVGFRDLSREMPQEELLPIVAQFARGFEQLALQWLKETLQARGVLLAPSAHNDPFDYLFTTLMRSEFDLLGSFFRH